MAGLILDLGAKHDDDPYDSEDYYDYDTCHDSHEMQITKSVLAAQEESNMFCQNRCAPKQT